MNKGSAYAALAYFFWGIFPIYWKFLSHVPAYEILGHRMFWTFLVAVFILFIRRDHQWLKKLKNYRISLTFMITGVLIACNWFVFIWSVNNNFIVEASLGYFINPLVHVLFGVIFLREHMRRMQLVAILIAAAGVLYLTISYGKFPWIAMFLAISFAIYAILRKTSVLNSLEGLAVETGFLFIPAMMYILFLQVNKTGALFNTNLLTTLLLMGAGLITAIPLLLFAAGARRVPLYTIGILQYIAPTGQFLIGVFLNHEYFPRVRLIGFIIIWIALALYTAENLYHYYRRQRKAANFSTVKG